MVWLVFFLGVMTSFPSLTSMMGPGAPQEGSREVNLSSKSTLPARLAVTASNTTAIAIINAATFDFITGVSLMKKLFDKIVS